MLRQRWIKVLRFISLATQEEVSISIRGRKALGNGSDRFFTYDNIITGHVHHLVGLALCESVCTSTHVSIKGDKTSF